VKLNILLSAVAAVAHKFMVVAVQVDSVQVLD
jgi:hypothetical protein